MSKPSLINFIKSDDRWMEVSEPENIQEKVLNFIDRNIYKKIYLTNVFKYASVCFFALCLVLTSALLVNLIKPTRVVIVYPHNAGVENVEIIGNFDHKNERIQMTLDKEKDVWTGEISTHKKHIDDYTINVYEADADNENGDTDPEGEPI